MPYREDEYLNILQYCTNEELGLLVDLIRKGAPSTEELSKSRVFERYFPNHKKYWKKIAEEIQLFGGNSIANLLRGSGVLYKDICFDVARHLKLPFPQDIDVIHLEQLITKHVLKKSITNMTQAEKEMYIQQLRSQRRFSFTGGAHPGIAMITTILLPGGFLALSITGPAYRITIPAVLLIASFRQRIQEETKKSTI